MATKVQDEPVTVRAAAQDAAETVTTKKPDTEKEEELISSISTTTEETAAKIKEQKSDEPTSPAKKKTEIATTKEDKDDISAKDIIDDVVFGQLLEMDDDDEEHDFSKSIVINYFEQAQETFEKMDIAIEKRDLAEYAKLGHFLKGSSATLGLQKVQAICEKIQNSHASANEESLPEFDGDVVLKCGIELLAQLKHEYKQAERYLCRFYDMDESIFDIDNDE